MDKDQLKQLRYLKSEIELLKKQIEDLDYTTTTDMVKGSSPGFPYIFQSLKIRGVDYQGYNNKLSRYQRRLEKRVNELIDLLEETTEYIDNISDSITRQSIMLKYVEGLEWEEVADRIGGGNTAEGLRKRVQRYFNRI